MSKVGRSLVMKDFGGKTKSCAFLWVKNLLMIRLINYLTSKSHGYELNSLLQTTILQNLTCTLLQVLNLLTPIVKLMRMADGNAPCAGKVYYHCFKVRAWRVEFQRVRR
jgi:hypothetical protein